MSSTTGPIRLPSAGPAPLSLALRRPGHAVMSHLLTELARREAGRRVPPDLMSWYSGAEGELVVGQELARLPEGWAVLHAVPAGPVADIDHLVVGPPGVVVVSTKRHRGARVRVGMHAVWIDGARATRVHRDLLDRAADVGGRLDGAAPVVPLLVLVDAAALGTTGPQTVDAVESARLVDHLLRLPAVLDAPAVDALAARLACPATWGRSASVLHEPDPTAAFLALVPQPRPEPAGPHAPVAPRVGVRACSSAPTPRYSAEELRRIVHRTLAAAVAVVLAPAVLVAVAGVLEALVRAR